MYDDVVDKDLVNEIYINEPSSKVSLTSTYEPVHVLRYLLKIRLKIES